EPRAEQILLAGLASLLRPHGKIPPPDHLRARESRRSIRRNPSRRICKKTAVSNPESCKIEYCDMQDRPTPSMRYEFFTDDKSKAPLVWWFGNPLHSHSRPLKRISEPNHTRIVALLVVFDANIRKRACREGMRMLA